MHQNPLPSHCSKTLPIQLGSMFVLLLGGCLRSSPHEVVVYSALDGEFSGPILQQFQQERGRVVRSNFDVESTKTVGLVTRIIREQRRPRCDRSRLRALRGAARIRTRRGCGWPVGARRGGDLHGRSRDAFRAAPHRR